jgi:uncharacterized protein YeaO (DUF488 family)
MIFEGMQKILRVYREGGPESPALDERRRRLTPCSWKCWMTDPTDSSDVRLKRAYAPASPEDGVRILVDRLWPRGLRKSIAGIDRWAKDLAPSTELRRWFGHDPSRWDEFQRKYRTELAHHAEALNELRALAQERRLTLVFAAHDEIHNEAVVLRAILTQ